MNQENDRWAPGLKEIQTISSSSHLGTKSYQLEDNAHRDLENHEEQLKLGERALSQIDANISALNERITALDLSTSESQSIEENSDDEFSGLTLNDSQLMIFQLTELSESVGAKISEAETSIKSINERNQESINSRNHPAEGTTRILFGKRLPVFHMAYIGGDRLADVQSVASSQRQFTRLKDAIAESLPKRLMKFVMTPRFSFISSPPDSTSELVLISDFLPLGSIQTAFVSRAHVSDQLPSLTIMDYTSALVRLLSILNLLHKKRQLNHCNIHPENILVEVQHHHDQLQQEQQPQAGGEKPTGRRTLNFILVDFTPPIILEPLILKLKSEIVAPPLWIAPELIKDILDAPSPLQWTSYHTAVDFHKIDIYALGWTMASLITRIFPSRCLTDFCHIHDTGRMMMDALKLEPAVIVI
eukprot:GHVH01011558.1.p1 GENE.GHVH01011558.1~~GHVH01011558.1.p1  ORF type:complete len:417 (+),score=65.09 GHVH01011558.1:69-1319(+)